MFRVDLHGLQSMENSLQDQISVRKQSLQRVDDAIARLAPMSSLEDYTYALRRLNAKMEGEVASLIDMYRKTIHIRYMYKHTEEEIVREGEDVGEKNTRIGAGNINIQPPGIIPVVTPPGITPTPIVPPSQPAGPILPEDPGAHVGFDPVWPEPGPVEEVIEMPVEGVIEMPIEVIGGPIGLFPIDGTIDPVIQWPITIMPVEPGRGRLEPIGSLIGEIEPPVDGGQWIELPIGGEITPIKDPWPITIMPVNPRIGIPDPIKLPPVDGDQWIELPIGGEVTPIKDPWPITIMPVEPGVGILDPIIHLPVEPGIGIPDPIRHFPVEPGIGIPDPVGNLPVEPGIGVPDPVGNGPIDGSVTIMPVEAGPIESYMTEHTGIHGTIEPSPIQAAVSEPVSSSPTVSTPVESTHMESAPVGASTAASGASEHIAAAVQPSAPVSGQGMSGHGAGGTSAGTHPAKPSTDIKIPAPDGFSNPGLSGKNGFNFGSSMSRAGTAGANGLIRNMLNKNLWGETAGRIPIPAVSKTDMFV